MILKLDVVDSGGAQLFAFILSGQGKACGGGSILSKEDVFVKVTVEIGITLLDWFKVDEKDGESAVPEVNLTLVFSLLGLFDLFVDGVEGDHVAEQVLKPGLKNGAK